jgi:hypothetical protein
MAAAAPFAAMFNDPIGQGSFKANIVSSFLRLDPFVFHNLLLFRFKLAVKRGFGYQVMAIGTLGNGLGHNRVMI